MAEILFPWSEGYAAERLHMKVRAFRELCGKVEATNPGVSVRPKKPDEIKPYKDAIREMLEAAAQKENENTS